MAKIEKDCVDMKFALEQCCGDEELLSELLEGLPEEIEAQNKEMEKGIKANDHTKLYRAAHAVKGAALTLGAGPLADTAKALEHCGRQLVTAVEKGLKSDVPKLLKDRTKFNREYVYESNRLMSFIKARSKNKKK